MKPRIRKVESKGIFDLESNFSIPSPTTHKKIAKNTTQLLDLQATRFYTHFDRILYINQARFILKINPTLYMKFFRPPPP